MHKLLLILMISCYFTATTNLAKAMTPTPPTATSTHTGREYESVFNYFAREAGNGIMPITEHAERVRAINQQFADICGDTFCAGDLSNLTPLDFTCSVRIADHKIMGCLWTFAGTYTEIDTHTGAMRPHTQNYHCDLALTGSPSELTTFLRTASQGGESGYDGLTKVSLPGASHTLYQALIKCL